MAKKCAIKGKEMPNKKMKASMKKDGKMGKMSILAETLKKYKIKSNFFINKGVFQKLNTVTNRNLICKVNIKKLKTQNTEILSALLKKSNIVKAPIKKSFIQKLKIIKSFNKELTFLTSPSKLGLTLIPNILSVLDLLKAALP